MSETDKYFGVGGNYRIDANGNRVPAESWPDEVLAKGAPEDTVKPASEETKAADPAPERDTQKPAKTTILDKE